MIREYFSPALQFFGAPTRARRWEAHEEHDDRAPDGDEPVFDDDTLSLDDDEASLDDDVLPLDGDDDETTVE